MALLYRAIWKDDRPSLLDVAGAAWDRWLIEKGIDPDGGYESRHIGGPQPGTAEHLPPRREAAAGVTAERYRLIEDRSNTGERWTVTFICLVPSDQAGGTLWVDVERLSENRFERLLFQAPRLARDLIASGERSGGDPRVEQVRLTSEPKAITGRPLAGLIRSPTRVLPLVAFSHDYLAGKAGTMDRAGVALKRLAGVAQVFVLPPEEIDPFKAWVGDDLGVWGGAARLYLPNLGVSDLRPERHRYVPRYRLERHVGMAGALFGQLLAPSVAATMPPADYEKVRRAFTAGPGAHNSDQIYAEWDESLKEIDTLRARVEVLEEGQLDLLEENEQLQEELNRTTGQLNRSHNRARALDVTEAALPDQVDSIEHAVQIAQKELSGCCIPHEAIQDTQRLEDDISARAWANGVWRALRALDAYATDQHRPSGGFWQWCQSGTGSWTWPASPKKLAMSESETVMANTELREARIFPVSTRVDRDGKMLMKSHIKIAEGGGPLAPRIYFVDDTSGATGQVHVGFIGPHDLVPNTKRS